MATLAELLAQRQAIEKQISAMQGEARAEAIAKVRSLMAEHGLTAADITNRQPTAARATSEVRKTAPVKYRDEKGNTWSGRGLKPKWLAAAIASGKKLEDFVI